MGANYQEALGSLLEAVQAPEQWSQALRSVASSFHADHVFAYLVSPDNTQPYTSSGSREILEKVVADNWHERNPRMLRGLQHARSGPVGVLTDWRLFSPDEIAHEPFEQEFAIKFDCVHYAGSFIPIDNDSFLVLSMERSKRRGAFLGSELEDVARFIEMTNTALSYAIRAQKAVTASLMDSLGSEKAAWAWLDGFARPCHYSASFNAMAGRFFGSRNGRLAPLCGDIDRFDFLVAMAAAGEQINANLIVANPANRADTATVRIVPLRTIARDMAARSDVLLSIEANPMERPSIEAILVRNFGLTKAEVRLALLISEGKTLRSAAETERITYETARSRLKIVFNKLSVSRQADLILKVSELLKS